MQLDPLRFLNAGGLLQPHDPFYQPLFALAHKPLADAGLVTAELNGAGYVGRNSLYRGAVALWGAFP